MNTCHGSVKMVDFDKQKAVTLWKIDLIIEILSLSPQQLVRLPVVSWK